MPAHAAPSFVACDVQKHWGFVSAAFVNGDDTPDELTVLVGRPPREQRLE